MVVENGDPLIVGLTFNRTSQSFQGRPFQIRVSSATSEGPAAALSTPFYVYRSLLTLQSPFPQDLLVGKDLPIVLSHDPVLGVQPSPSITVTLLYADKQSNPQKRTRSTNSVELSLRSPSLSINGTSAFAIKVNELSSDHVMLPFVIKFWTKEDHDICPCYTPPFSVVTSSMAKKRSTSTTEQTTPKRVRRIRTAPTLPKESSQPQEDFLSMQSQNLGIRILTLCEEIRDLLKLNPKTP
jgi:hypothetical protein